MAVRFDGSGGDDLAVNISFSAADTGTICFWAKISGDRDTWSSFVETRYVSGGDLLVLQTDSDGTTLLIWTASGASGTNLTVGTWYHLALTSDPTGSTHRAYINGVLDITHAGTSRTWTKIRLGNDGSSEPLNGVIAYPKAWDATLTAAELLAEKDTILPQRSANLVGFWPIYLGDRLSDYSGQKNNFAETGTVTDEGPPSVGLGASFISPPYIVAGAPPAAAIMNQMQNVNLGADLFNGALIL